MAESARPRAIGFNHVALEVGDIEEALAFYGRLFTFELRGKSDTMAFIDLGDQFIALQKGRRQPADDGRHFGLVSTTRRRLARRSMPRESTRLTHASSTFAIPGATASRSSATTISSSPTLPMCCVAWV